MLWCAKRASDVTSRNWRTSIVGTFLKQNYQVRFSFCETMKHSWGCCESVTFGPTRNLVEPSHHVSVNFWYFVWNGCCIPVILAIGCFWCQLVQVALEKRPLNGCSSSSSSLCYCLFVYVCFCCVKFKNRNSVNPCECRSEVCCTRLAGNTGCKKLPFWHHRTTLSGYIFGTKACIDNRKKSC